MFRIKNMGETKIKVRQLKFFAYLCEECAGILKFVKSNLEPLCILGVMNQS